MGCCGTKPTTTNKDKALNKQEIQSKQPLQKQPEVIKNTVEENKTTINTDNKNRADVPNGTTQNEKLNQLNNYTPTQQQSEIKQEYKNQQSEVQNGLSQQNNSQLKDLNTHNSGKENNVDIRKANTLAMAIKEEDIDLELKKKEQEQIDPNTLKGVSQTLTIQQMRMSKIDKQTVVGIKEHQQNHAKSLPGSECDLQDEPAANMNNYQQPVYQNKAQKDNILNKHMKSIMNSLKTNDYVSKSIYSTPPVLYVDTDNNSKGEWMQVETFGVYGKTEQNDENQNFMND